ncbi:hypothetical protein GCM10029964_082430 [Kibdelosporangium lantanae]
MPTLTPTKVAHHVEDADSPFATHPALRPYLTDLAATQGLALREEVLGTGQAYAQLAAPVIEAVTAIDEPVDLLVLAYGVPDVQPGRHAALHLAAHCPGRPLAFAICDQGPTAAFTALRLIADHPGDRALLVVAEQSAVPYPLTAPAPVPDRHAAVAVLFERRSAAALTRRAAVPPQLEPGPVAVPLSEPGPSAIVVRTHVGLPPDAVATVLVADVAELAGADATLVFGSGVDSSPPGARDVLRADPGLPYTGLWARLADVEPGRMAVVADYDPTLGYLCLAAMAAT